MPENIRRQTCSFVLKNIQKIYSKIGIAAHFLHSSQQRFFVFFTTHSLINGIVSELNSNWSKKKTETETQSKVGIKLLIFLFTSIKPIPPTWNLKFNSSPKVRRPKLNSTPSVHRAFCSTQNIKDMPLFNDFLCINIQKRSKKND